MIEIRLFATFREGREKLYSFHAEDFRSADRVLHHLGIKSEEVAILLINGRHSATDAALADGDVVAIFPPVGGG